MRRPSAGLAVVSMAAVGLGLAAGSGALEPRAIADEFRYLSPGEAARVLRCDAPPDGWQRPEFDDAGWSDVGAAAKPDGKPDARGEAKADGGAPRCEALRMRRRFDVGPELARLATLTLDVKYQDGFVAWVNGVEVARRRYEGGELATMTHGPESEQVIATIAPGLLRSTGNVLALEVHAARVGRAAQAEIGLGGADALRILRGPQLLSVDGGRARIALDTDLPCRAEVRVEPEPDATPARGERARPLTATSDALDTRHTLVVDGLTPGRTYRYQVTLREPLGTAPVTVAASFHTPPTAAHPLRFVVTGDVRSGHAVHEQIVRAIVAEDPDLVLMTGDLVDMGDDDAEWQRFFSIEAPLLRQVPVVTALGNHDRWRKDEGLAKALALFGRAGEKPWSSFDLAGAHFVLLDSESYRNPEQLSWLAADLAAARARSARAIFVATHHGPYSSALHGDDSTATKDYVPLLEAAGVTMLFEGHDHDYERGHVGALDYVVTGGGGAELRAPRCGVPGKKRCGSRVRAFANEHHYVVVELAFDSLRVCPKRPDGTLLEPCPTLPVPRAPSTTEAATR